MQRTRAPLAVLLLCIGGALATSLAQLPQQAVLREWSVGATTLKATLVSYDGESASLRTPDGRVSSHHASELGEPDRAFLDQWRDSQPISLPPSVGVDSNKLVIEVVEENNDLGSFLYRTPHFEFVSEGRLTQNLLRDIARNFEATYELLKTLPWDVQPRPEEGERFKAKLVRSRQRYTEMGGPPNTGGVYFSSKQMFLIPFESLGLKPLGNSYSKAPDYRSDTLVHELTHQMMHASLHLLPQWVIEGTAEYTNVLPLRLGTFRLSSAKSAVNDYLDYLKTRGGIPEPFPLDRLLTISGKEWSETVAASPKESRRLYFTAFLLVNYFMSLDGRGDGARFVRYMREIAKARRADEEYEKSWRAFLQQPGVEDLGNGRFRSPPDMPPPTRPAFLESPEALEAFVTEKQSILLDGRSVSELASQVRAAYRRYDIKL